MFVDSALHLLSGTVALRQAQDLGLDSDLRILLVGVASSFIGRSRSESRTAQRRSSEFFAYDPSGFGVRLEVDEACTEDPLLEPLLATIASRESENEGILMFRVDKFGLESLVADWLATNPRPPPVVRLSEGGE